MSPYLVYVFKEKEKKLCDSVCLFSHLIAELAEVGSLAESLHIFVIYLMED